MKLIRWGIIGCGDVCEVKSGPAFRKADGSTLAAVMRRNGAKAEDYAKRHGVPQWYDDANKLIADPSVDAVYVATPPGTHLEYALRVAAAGKPCYVEKPMARSHAECARMIDAFQRGKLPLFVAYYRRALPRFVKVRELIDSGALGRVTGCRYRMSRLFRPTPSPQWRLDPAQSGGGIFLDIGSHVIDLLDHLLGEFVDYGGDASTTGATAVEDVVALHFRTARGVVGSASWNFASSLMEERLEIDGTEGRLSCEVLGYSPLTLTRGKESENFELPDPPHIQQPLIQTIVDELLGRGGTTCPSTGASAARTSAVMDAALSRFYNGRDDEFWARPQTWGDARRAIIWPAHRCS
jgi:1,5-anhydro-D-fructose reductase (1,5-anhydro-D-mannitol-forming)